MPVEQFARWVRERTDIFERVCLPGVLQQVRKPARWYIGVDGEHLDLVEPLCALVEPHPWIVVVPQGPDEKFHEALWSAVINGLPATATHLATTRLDGDDALAIDHLRAVQTYARAVISRPECPDDTWIAFPHGAQLVGDRYALYVHNRNAFLTRVITAEAAQGGPTMSAYQGRHSRIFTDGKYVVSPMTTTPMWLQHVHGGNVANYELGDGLVYAEPEKVAGYFGL